jgi:mono/diheme cytochrome c family protein
MAVYLKALPQAPPKGAEPPWWTFFTGRKQRAVTDETQQPRGAKIYADQCADCHGKNGEGAREAYPRLAGNRAITMEAPANVIRAVLSGGYPPTTAGNPRPYGMPPFAHVLNDDEIAAVASYIRASWGNAAQPITAFEVQQYRAPR